MTDWNYDTQKLVKKLGGSVIKMAEVSIKCVTTVGDPRENAMLFFTSKKWKNAYADRLLELKNCFIVTEHSIADVFGCVSDSCCIVAVDNARLYFAKALELIIDSENSVKKYTPYGCGSFIGENVIIGNDCRIEPFVFIDHDVVIGNGVSIKSGVKIRQCVKIEDNVTIGENSVIGVQGFGVEKDTDGRNIRIPHIGGVIIKENVEIGALSSIVAGTIHPTVIEKNVFIDDLNHIAHNCQIGEGSMLTAAAQIGGSAAIGADSYISPNATVRNGVSLGKNCFVGQGSSVQQSFGDGVSLVGNPAREFMRKK